MKTKGKYLLLGLALALGSAVLPGPPALATPGDIAPPAFSDIAGHEAESELTLLAALGVYSGDSGLGGPVRPDAPITRAEFCKVLVTAVGRGSTARGLMALPPAFADAASIPSWAWGYVNVADYMDVVDGYNDGTFRAGNPVTYAEAVTMLVRAVGGHRTQVPPGEWPYNYIFWAVDHGFTGTVDVSAAGLPATRGDIARLLFATMQVPRLGDDGTVVPDSAVLFDRVEQTAGADTPDNPADDVFVHHGRLYRGEVTGYDPGADHGGTSASPTLTLAEGGATSVVPLGDPVHLVGATEWRGLLGLKVLAVAGAGMGEGTPGLCFVAVDETAQARVEVFARYRDTDGDGRSDAYEFDSGAMVPYTADTLVTVNGLEPARESGSLLQKGDECRLAVGADGKASSVRALRFDLGSGYVSEEVVHSTATTDTLLTVSCESEYAVGRSALVTLNGATANRDALERWDVVELATAMADGSYNPGDPDSNPIFAVRATRSVVEGVVTSSRTHVTADGTAYYITLKTPDGKQTEYRASPSGSFEPGDIPSGRAAKFGLDASGWLFVQIDYEMPTYRALAVRYEEGTTGDSPDYRLTLDIRGRQEVYEAADPDSAYTAFPEVVGTVGRVELGNSDNVVYGFYPWVDDGLLYDIVTVDGSGGSVTLRGADGTIVFVKDAVVYKYENGSYSYVPTADVQRWKSDLTGASQVSVVQVEPEPEDYERPVLVVYSVLPVATVEPNGPDAAVTLTPQVRQAWLRFRTVEGRVYGVQIPDWQPYSCPWIALFQQGETAPFAEGFSCTFTAPSDGWVYARAWLPYDDDDLFGSYAVRVTEVGETVTDLSLGTPVQGQLSSADPEQWYRFPVTAGTLYVVETTGLSPAACDTVVEILQPYSEYRFVNDEASPPESDVPDHPGLLFYGHASQLKWTAYYTGYAFVRVTPGGSSDNPYGTYSILATAPAPVPGGGVAFEVSGLPIEVGPTGIWTGACYRVNLGNFPVTDGTTYYIVLDGYGVGVPEGMGAGAGWTSNPSTPPRLYRNTGSSYSEVTPAVCWHAPGGGWFLVYTYNANAAPTSDGRLYITFSTNVGTWRLRVLTTDPRGS